MELTAAGILAALAATVLAAHTTGRKAAATLAAAGIVAAAVFRWAGVPDVSNWAFCMAAALGTVLVRPRWWFAPLAAGVCAAAWISILEVQGLPWLPAALLAVSVTGVAVGLAQRRAGFASAEVRDEAVVLVSCFALLLALGPELVDGWRSATALAAEPLSADVPSVGPWLGAFVIGCLLMGGVYSLWKRR